VLYISVIASQFSFECHHGNIVCRDEYGWTRVSWGTFVTTDHV